jgi:hypothetical protein
VQEDQRPLQTTLPVDESVIRLAERIANRYGVTVQQLIETLLLECHEREPVPPPPPPRASRRSRGRVIELADARRRREGLQE